MFWQTNWFADLRAVLELVYFMSGITIAIAAIFALKQISLTKEITKKNARRESVKLATELSRYYAETVIPQWGKALTEYNAQHLGYLTVLAKPAFVLKDGEIVSNKFDQQSLPKGKQHEAGIQLINFLEAFAIPFVAGVADEDIGYTETAQSFRIAVEQFMPLIYRFLVNQEGRFESTVKLYEHRRIVAAGFDAPAPAILERGGGKTFGFYTKSHGVMVEVSCPEA